MNFLLVAVIALLIMWQIGGSIKNTEYQDAYEKWDGMCAGCKKPMGNEKVACAGIRTNERENAKKVYWFGHEECVKKMYAKVYKGEVDYREIS